MFYSAKQIGLTNVRNVEDRITNRKKLTKAEIRNIFNYDWEKRYHYFMQTCVKHQEIWSAWCDEGMFIFEWDWKKDTQWHPYSIPVFPHEDLAKKFFENYEGKLKFTPIPIDDFIDEIFPPLQKEKVLVCIFPNDTSKETITISFDDFIIDLTGCWEEYYNVELKIDPEIKSDYLDYRYKLILKRQMKGKPVGKLP